MVSGWDDQDRKRRPDKFLSAVSATLVARMKCGAGSEPQNPGLRCAHPGLRAKSAPRSPASRHSFINGAPAARIALAGLAQRAIRSVRKWR